MTTQYTCTDQLCWFVHSCVCSAGHGFKSGIIAPPPPDVDLRGGRKRPRGVSFFDPLGIRQNTYCLLLLGLFFLSKISMVLLKISAKSWSPADGVTSVSLVTVSADAFSRLLLLIKVRKSGLNRREGKLQKRPMRDELCRKARRAWRGLVSIDAASLGIDRR